MTEIINIDIELKNIITNYKKLYNFIFLYKDELINVLDDKFTIDSINSIINNDKIDSLIKELEHNKLKLTNLNLKYFMLFNNTFEELTDMLKENIKFIKNVDIYEKKYLISDTSKNNINQNQTLILDLYKKYKKKNKELMIKLTESLFHNLNIKDNYKNIFLEITNKFEYNEYNIKFYIFFINYLNTIQIDNDFLNVIELYNNYIKDNLLIGQLKKLNIKYNENYKLLFNNNKKFNNNYFSIDKIQLFNNYSNLKLIKKYKLLSELFIQELNINKYQKISYSDHDKISQVINLFYKIDKSHLMIIIIKSKLDSINYNLTTLLDNNIIINSLDGINDDFIEKTKTIIPQLEYINKIKDIDNYIANINNITVYHNKFLYNDETNLNNIAKYLNTPVLLINFDNYYYNIFSKNNNIFLQLKDVYHIIVNEPDFGIENYNNIINEQISHKINNFNILNKYKENINQNYNLYSDINHIELKNLIINKIKNIDIGINNENKNKVIDLILEIISTNIYEYFNKKTNIKFHSELYIVFLSNSNSILNKIKKELVDNYSDKLLINIDNIINDQYHNIQNMIENILDKYHMINI